MTTAEQCAALGMISERDFEDVWGVYLRPDGDFFCYADVVNQRIEHVWTVVETGWAGDENWYAVPGIHYVNRIGYVMTKQPWEDAASDAVYFLDDITALNEMGEEDMAGPQE